MPFAENWADPQQSLHRAWLTVSRKSKIEFFYFKLCIAPWITSLLCTHPIPSLSVTFRAVLLFLEVLAHSKQYWTIIPFVDDGVLRTLPCWQPEKGHVLLTPEYFLGGQKQSLTVKKSILLV